MQEDWFEVIKLVMNGFVFPLCVYYITSKDNNKE